ncbi:flagellar export chaperone FliS [Rhodospirillaceae bacterium SYSU D60014]|uniref:flagellar export chaperone FliS n=1 Tax=Virgifigura deserti TaxID=2268457 RepID=UPI000E662C39
MTIITSYRLEDMMAAAPSRIVVMLYDEAIGALRTAIEACKADDIEQRCGAVTAATEIVGHLYMHLDLERGGEVALGLGAIYGQIIGRLPRVNLYNDFETAEEAIAMLEPLRESWEQLDRMIAQAGNADGVDPMIAASAATSQGAMAGGAGEAVD